MLVRSLRLAPPQVELSETQTAAGSQRRHPEGLGEQKGLTVGCGGGREVGVRARPDRVADQAERVRGMPTLVTLLGEAQGIATQAERGLNPRGGEIGETEPDEAERMAGEQPYRDSLLDCLLEQGDATVGLAR